MQEQPLETRGVGAAVAANGATRGAKKRSKPRPFRVEEKIRVARESFATDETVAAVARRYGISRYRLSSWRSLFRQGKLVARVSGSAQADRGFAALAVHERSSVTIEGAGVTVRLDGAMEPSGIAAIAVALAEVRRWSR